MASLVYVFPRRGVRTMVHRNFKAPWAYFYKSKGLSSVGPFHQDHWGWPNKSSGFAISPKFLKNNHPRLRGYTGCQPTGYLDEKLGKFVDVPEMKPKLIVPDLKGFNLKPYVSFRCSETAVVEPPMDAKKLFDAIYAEDIKKAYRSGKYKQVETTLTNDRRKILEKHSIPTVSDVKTLE